MTFVSSPKFWESKITQTSRKTTTKTIFWVTNRKRFWVCICVFVGMFFSGHADFHQSCGIPPVSPTMASWNFPTMNESMYFLFKMGKISSDRHVSFRECRSWTLMKTAKCRRCRKFVVVVILLLWVVLVLLP